MEAKASGSPASATTGQTSAQATGQLQTKPNRSFLARELETLSLLKSPPSLVKAPVARQVKWPSHTRTDTPRRQPSLPSLTSLGCTLADRASSPSTLPAAFPPRTDTSIPGVSRARLCLPGQLPPTAGAAGTPAPTAVHPRPLLHGGSHPSPPALRGPATHSLLAHPPRPQCQKQHLRRSHKTGCQGPPAWQQG